MFSDLEQSCLLLSLFTNFFILLDFSSAQNVQLKTHHSPGHLSKKKDNNRAIQETWDQKTYVEEIEKYKNFICITLQK